MQQSPLQSPLIQFRSIMAAATPKLPSIHPFKMSTNELKDRLNELQCEVRLLQEELGRRQAEENAKTTDKLSKEDGLRYSRQLLLKELGVEGQLRLKKSSVLIVGCGGLGCPASQYLTAAGVSRIGLVDLDAAELSNLHRQILLDEYTLGVNKAEVVKRRLQALNSNVTVETFGVLLNSSNALSIVSKFDVIIDASDNAATRYLVNDACTILNKPLVSGSALRFEGQVTVYNYKNGPTYRCLFPKPPPAHLVTNCSDGGVLGPVVGVIGALQALEALKIITDIENNDNGSKDLAVLSGRMLLFDALNCSFRTIKLRPRNEAIVASVKTLIDYEQFCGAAANDKNRKGLALVDDRISAKQLQQLSEGEEDFMVLDVRPRHELKIARLPIEPMLNVPMDELESNIEDLSSKSSKCQQLIVVCRRGNDSQQAVLKLRASPKLKSVRVRDVEGGLYEWQKQVDPELILY